MAINSSQGCTADVQGGTSVHAELTQPENQATKSPSQRQSISNAKWVCPGFYCHERTHLTTTGGCFGCPFRRDDAWCSDCSLDQAHEVNCASTAHSYLASACKFGWIANLSLRLVTIPHPVPQRFLLVAFFLIFFLALCPVTPLALSDFVP